MSAYSEATIGNALARHTFKGSLCVLDNCTWPGSECDLLAVTESLRVVDVEIKISRADLKADRTKDKWYRGGTWDWQTGKKTERLPIDWPRNVWKHYYAVAAPIWREDLLEFCGTKSGVLVVTLNDEGRFRGINCVRRARSNPEAKPLDAKSVAQIARLASLRMWDAYMGRRGIPAALQVGGA